MAKKILFIGNTNSFVTKAVLDELKKADYHSIECSPTVYAIERGVKDADALFLYVDEAVLEHPDALVYIKDICLEEEKKVFMMGYPDQLGRILGGMEEVVGAVFERPINTRDVVDKLVNILEKEGNKAKKKHILVVDDNGTTLRNMKNALEPEYRVSIVNSAINAMTFIGSNKPDLILLDYEMPVCSGPMMLEMLRSELDTEDIPVCFLTSKGDKESIQKVLKFKPQGYLLKSHPNEKIIEFINNFFEQEKEKRKAKAKEMAKAKENS